ncbi:MAG TPA: L-serine ammonia-lyase, iron-sulfur-dependent, subunit beta [Candidatus Avacidaminococcus intestinavium]|uniref:L-serine deaminase n=1 Tax=Candidatus Avacidaminococcus intestinavium TaxID=2840684 RepID=A0A9D1MPT4_9FIRM|nr:L-serine ammonia-lyase, iron-sulfur-dependent, subunit beta [Candidatus Avacidaminococcus intestinavium]
MKLLDIIGPVMIGPSSSHTAGAVRLGLLARGILGEQPSEARIELHGSFARTYRGHGTDLALLAGLMGWRPDDERIPEAKNFAQANNLQYAFEQVNLGELLHPNTVRLHLKGLSGTTCTVMGSSVGGGQVLVTEIDGFPVELNGSLPGLLVPHRDQCGVIALVSQELAVAGINIAGMRVFRTDKGGIAIMIIECDQAVDLETIKKVELLPAVESVRFINSVL